LIVSQKKPLRQMIATLRTIFFLRHNRAARKSQLKMQAAHDANQGESECDKNERWLMALGNRKAIPSFFRWRTAVDGERVVSR
jgi:hypothetical protein